MSRALFDDSSRFFLFLIFLFHTIIAKSAYTIYLSSVFRCERCERKRIFFLSNVFVYKIENTKILNVFYWHEVSCIRVSCLLWDLFLEKIIRSVILYAYRMSAMSIIQIFIIKDFIRSFEKRIPWSLVESRHTHNSFSFTLPRIQTMSN